MQRLSCAVHGTANYGTVAPSKTSCCTSKAFLAFCLSSSSVSTRTWSFLPRGLRLRERVRSSSMVMSVGTCRTRLKDENRLMYSSSSSRRHASHQAVRVLKPPRCVKTGVSASSAPCFHAHAVSRPPRCTRHVKRLLRNSKYSSSLMSMRRLSTSSCRFDIMHGRLRVRLHRLGHGPRLPLRSTRHVPQLGARHQRSARRRQRLEQR